MGSCFSPPPLPPQLSIPSPMLASVYRTATAKSVKSLVPQLGSTSSVAAHNLVSRRFKSGDAVEEEEPRPQFDTLMSIITGSINAQTAGSVATDQARLSRGNFRKGDIYKPSDLNDSKTITYARPPKPVDELKILKVNPVVEYKNATLLSHYITPLGRLMSREQTGLSAKNQRRVAKAVRRARAMCIISPTAKLH
ncbi:hypothetical protein BC939DRAFT_451969, partial [Gamsiella multidivaricata]|uniref:uncharacterized protein n=1 Tax=Gamsiella multidivaricata TaxID=101098 RepID=UPI0022206D1F